MSERCHRFRRFVVVAVVTAHDRPCRTLLSSPADRVLTLVHCPWPTYWGSRTWPCKVTWHHQSHDHSTNNMLFPIVSHWNWVSILKRFRDICIEIYRGNDLDLSGYVTLPGTWPLIPHVTESVPGIDEIIGHKHTEVTTWPF